MTGAAPSPIAATKSNFVTVVAWIFIAFSGFATFIPLLQNLMVAIMPKAFFNQARKAPTLTRTMPAGPRFMFAHFQLMVLVMFIVCAATLISSIGLLRRHNWARLVFVTLLGLGGLYNVGAIFLQQSMTASFGRPFPAGSALGPADQQFQQMVAPMKATMVVIEIGFAALFCWIIVKLVSPPIRAEFIRYPPA